MNFGKFEDKIKKLELLISKMDIPFYRKKIKSNKDIRWLNKNIGIKNINDNNFEEVQKILMEVI